MKPALLSITIGSECDVVLARLEAMGYDKPKEEKIEINVAYGTRLFRRSSHHLKGALFASIAAMPPLKEAFRGEVGLGGERLRTRRY
jgi:hypothetical protein